MIVTKRCRQRRPKWWPNDSTIRWEPAPTVFIPIGYDPDTGETTEQEMTLRMLHRYIVRLAKAKNIDITLIARRSEEIFTNTYEQPHRLPTPNPNYVPSLDAQHEIIRHDLNAYIEAAREHGLLWRCP